MAKIELSDTFTDAVVKMAEGNPGAINVLMALMTEAGEIDPDAAMGGMGFILLLDTLGIYGCNVYQLGNDVCEKDLRKLVLLLRANQMGLFDDYRLKSMASDPSRQSKLSSEEWQQIDEKICEQLPNFKKAA